MASPFLKEKKYMLENYSDIINVKQLCEILMIGETTAYRILKSGDIKNIRIDNRYKIIKSSLIEYITKSN